MTVRVIYYTAAGFPTPSREAIGLATADEGDQGLGVLGWFHANVHAYSMSHAIDHEGYSVGEPVDGLDSSEVAPLIDQVAKRIGLKMDAAFVPFSLSRHAKADASGKVWRSLNWTVELRRGMFKMVTPYSQGEGYTPAGSVNVRRWENDRQKRAGIALEIEHGKWAQPSADGGAHITARPIAPPAVSDVLWSLATDAAVLDYADFESWASDYGYDQDSRSAEAMYRECMAATQSFRHVTGQAFAESRLIASFN